MTKLFLFKVLSKSYLNPRFNKTSFTVYIQGGLGNQLFQYATAYSYAKKFNRTITINRDRYYGYAWKKDSGFEIDKILLNLKIASPSFWTVFFENGRYLEIIGKVLRKILWLKKRTYKEKIAYKYDPIFLQNENWNGMIGFFQTPKYFESFQDDIIEMFDLPITTENSIKYKSLIENTECPVSIHYRDYGHLSSGNEKVKKKFGDISLEFYEKAMYIINQSEKNATYFIFSNSIKSAKEKFSQLNDVVFIDQKSEYGWEDMSLMALCKHNIICNSSYSWWSAYLNKNDDKIVVAPKNWGNKLLHKDSSNELFPKSWILI